VCQLGWLSLHVVSRNVGDLNCPILDIVWRKLSRFGVRHHRLGDSARRGARIGGGAPCPADASRAGQPRPSSGWLLVKAMDDGAAFSKHQESSKTGIENDKDNTSYNSQETKGNESGLREGRKDRMSTNMVLGSSVPLL
jgi:hypothetical protein